jgi:hypothetical protein
LLCQLLIAAAAAAAAAVVQAKEPASTMQAFEGLFEGVQFRKGLEIAFASHHKGQLVTQIDGKQVRYSL